MNYGHFANTEPVKWAGKSMFFKPFRNKSDIVRN